MDGGLPNGLSGGAIIAKYPLLLHVIIGCGEVDAVSHNDGGAVAVAGYFGGPFYILGLAKCDGRFLIGIGEAVSVWTAPPRPVFGLEAG